MKYTITISEADAHPLDNKITDGYNVVLLVYDVETPFCDVPELKAQPAEYFNAHSHDPEDEADKMAEYAREVLNNTDLKIEVISI